MTRKRFLIATLAIFLVVLGAFVTVKLTSDNFKYRNDYRKWWGDQQNFMNVAFKQSGVDSVSVSTDDDYVRSLLKLFQKRG